MSDSGLQTGRPTPAIGWAADSQHQASRPKTPLALEVPGIGGHLSSFTKRYIKLFEGPNKCSPAFPKCGDFTISPS
jgi:hypothetical protein